MRRRGRWLMRGGLLLAGLATAVAVRVATAPAITKQGVDFAVSASELPRYVKALDFLDRHLHYRLLARQVARAARTDEARALAVFRWTRANIRPTPRELPVVDDHVLHIIIRGHGVHDQMADVFTTLSTYAGVPAFWQVLRDPSAQGELVLAFARVGGRWAVFDVADGLVFRRPDGQLASAEELASDAALVQLTAGTRKIQGAPYAAYVARIAPFEVPQPLRAELQMPGPRCWYEIRRALGVERSQQHTALSTQHTEWRRGVTGKA